MRAAHEEELTRAVLLKEQAERRLEAPLHSPRGPAAAPVAHPLLDGFTEDERRDLLDWASLTTRRAEFIFAADRRWQAAASAALSRLGAAVEEWSALLASDAHVRMSAAARGEAAVDQQVRCGRLAREMEDARREEDAALMAGAEAFEAEAVKLEDAVRDALARKHSIDLEERHAAERAAAAGRWEGIGDAVRAAKTAELDAKHRDEAAAARDEATVAARERADARAAAAALRAAQQGEVEQAGQEWGGQVGRFVADLGYLLADHATPDELAAFRTQVASAWTLYTAQRNLLFERHTRELNARPNPFAAALRPLNLDALGVPDDRHIATLEELAFALATRPKLLACAVRCHPPLQAAREALGAVADGLAQVPGAAAAAGAVLQRIHCAAAKSRLPFDTARPPSPPRLVEASVNHATPSPGKRARSAKPGAGGKRLAGVLAKVEEALAAVGEARGVVEGAFAACMTYAERDAHRAVVGGVAVDQAASEKLRELPCGMEERGTLVEAANILLRLQA
eukprot:TRINITY_DN4855_c0_g1_i2.p2 TRINITY_DN4855_c0_g1~~TRINITY_DN4855_c0_g1_i2.p2  ORF type:complete len:514 (+),score=177.85 TRINITY_DN4855_c0_g1_i2:1654-3195(+)